MTGNHGFHACQPILRVADMARALDFYVGKLGFTNAPWAFPDFTSVNRDDAGVYLCLNGQGDGRAWIWIGVADADALHQELVTSGVAIRMAPVTYHWAREFHVEDPDGNVIRFGSDPQMAGDFRQDQISDSARHEETQGAQEAPGSAGLPKTSRPESPT
jgi:catechol 2,3-dioxygenase-like lactoylglutathione lyase family enzyme